MTITRLMAMLACGALLVLGACTGNKEDTAALEADLNAFRTSLVTIQETLGDDSTPAEQRAAVERAKKDLEAAETALEARPDGSTGKSEAAEALTSLRSALTAVEALLGASASGASGPVALASMRTTLDRAQDAIDAAQVKLKAALEAAPATDTALLGLLTRAQAALTAAQASLVPRVRSDLAQAELRASLVDAQAALKALGPGTTNAEQRAGAIEVLEDVEKNLKTVQDDLQEQPASAARTAVSAALTAVGTAVTRVKAALAPTPASGGTVSFADMHTDLDRAQAALDDAQTKIAAALETDGLTGALQTALAQAQAVLSTAQLSLVPELRSELAQAESDEAAQRARADALDPRVRLGDPVARTDRGGRPAAANAQLTGDGMNADFTYMPRTTYTAKIAPSGDALTVSANFEYTDPLGIKNEGVLHTAGKTVVGGAGGEELMLRGTVVRHALITDTNERPTVGEDNDKGLPILGHDERTLSTDATWYNWRFPMRSSIKLPSESTGGPTIEMGGPGIIGYDLEQRTRAKGGFCPSGQTGDTRTHCDDATTDDVRIAFTSQAVRDPHGDSAYYWQTDIPFDPEGRNSALFSKHRKGDEVTFGAEGTCAVTAATDAAGCTAAAADRSGVLPGSDGKAAQEVFVYGATPTPDPDGPKPLYDTPRLTCSVGNWCNDDPRDYGLPLSQGQYQVWLSHHAGKDDDDGNRLLQYAAYGLMRLLDYGLNFPVGVSRSQAFHFGYDAYGAGDNAVPTTGDPISATFKGRTTGWLMVTRDYSSSTVEVFDSTNRMRGDVELNAKIGGAGSDTNTITGDITGLQILREGVWGSQPVGAALGPVSLTAGTIATDGTYKGTAADIHGVFLQGAFEGAFYGDKALGELETAGSWYLPPNDAHGSASGSGLMAIIGAFGARSVPEPEE